MCFVRLLVADVKKSNPALRRKLNDVTCTVDGVLGQGGWTQINPPTPVRPLDQSRKTTVTTPLSSSPLPSSSCVLSAISCLLSLMLAHNLVTLSPVVSRGLAYYVATRFFDREFRNLQPGFILAFAEAECHNKFSPWLSASLSFSLLSRLERT